MHIPLSLPRFLLVLLPLCAGNSLRTEEILSIRVFALGGSESPVFSFWNGVDFDTLRASTVQPSPALRVTKANPLPVFTDPQTGPNGEPPQPTAWIPLPEDASHVLLLVTGNGNGNENGGIMAIEDDLHRADSRDWLFFNLTASAIAFQIGEETEPILIPPHSRFSRRMKLDASRGTPVIAAARIQGEVQKFYSTYWPIRQDRRTMVLFALAGENRIQLRRIVERLPPAHEEEEDASAP